MYSKSVPELCSYFYIIKLQLTPQPESNEQRTVVVDNYFLKFIKQIPSFDIINVNKL